MSDLGLFPLGIVLLPGERTALHIFEPRYRDLIGRCLEDGREFGLVLVDGAGLRKVGTRTRVVEVLERFEDGRLNVVVEGGSRFTFQEVKDELAYLTADAAEYQDTVPPPLDQEYAQVLEEYRKVVASGELELEEPKPGPYGLSFQIAAQMDLAPAARQELLELRDERARLAVILQLLAIAGAALRQRIIERRAATNGHVPRES